MSLPECLPGNGLPRNSISCEGRGSGQVQGEGYRGSGFRFRISFFLLLISCSHCTSTVSVSMVSVSCHFTHNVVLYPAVTSSVVPSSNLSVRSLIVY